MIEQDAQPKTKFGGALNTLRLIHITTAQAVRAKHRHPATGIIISIIQTLILLLIFVFLISALRGKGGGLDRTSPVNGGDIITFVMSGIFLFRAHNSAIQAIFSSPGVSSPLTNHQPINSTILLISAGLGELYTQLLGMSFILAVYHCAWKPLNFDNFIGFLIFFLLGWFAGVGIGLFAKAMQPWAPRIIGIAQTLYQRINMFSSGKMFLANSLPGDRRALFDWNPLFHAIDQARGEAFLNYTPRYTNWEYPLILALVMLTIGFIGEFYTRQQVSLSWGATR